MNTYLFGLNLREACETSTCCNMGYKFFQSRNMFIVANRYTIELHFCIQFAQNLLSLLHYVMFQKLPM